MPTISRIATTMIPSSSVPERPPELDEPVVFATVYGPVLAGVVVVVVLGVVSVGSTVPGVVAPVVLAAARAETGSAAIVRAAATASQLLARLRFRARPLIAAI
jgi:hypothetical protein